MSSSITSPPNIFFFVGRGSQGLSLNLEFTLLLDWLTSEAPEAVSVPQRWSSGAHHHIWYFYPNAGELNYIWILVFIHPLN